MEKHEYILGIDIGGTSIKIGVVKEGKVIESYSIRNIYKGHFNNLLPGIFPLCEKYIKKYFTDYRSGKIDKEDLAECCALAKIDGQQKVQKKEVGIDAATVADRVMKAYAEL